MPDRSAGGVAESAHAGLYAGTDYGDIAFRSGALVSGHAITTDRRVDLPGFSDTLSAGYGATSAQLFGELACIVDLGGARIEPFAGLAHVAPQPPS